MSAGAGPAPRPGGMRLPVHLSIWGGAALLVFLANVYPLLWLLYGSLTGEGGLTFAHFRELFTQSAYGRPILNSWVYALGSTGLGLLFGVPLAVAAARTGTRLKGLLQLTAIVTWISPPWLGAMAYVYLFAPNSGIVNGWMEQLFGIRPFNAYSMGAMILVTGVFTASYVFLTVQAALASSDSTAEQAARVAGAGPWTVLTKITLPLVRPALITSTLFSFIMAWGVFAIPAILGYPVKIYVFSTQLYQLLNAFPPKLGISAAVAVAFAVVALLLTMLTRSLTGDTPEGRFATVGGRGHHDDPLPFGRWVHVFSALGIVYFVFALVLPYAVIAWISLRPASFAAQGLTLDHYRYVLFEYPMTWQVLRNTFVASGAAAALATIVALVVAYARLRTRWPARNLVFDLAIFTVAVPLPAFIVGAVWGWIRPPLVLYGTLALVAAVQVSRNLPISTRNVRDGLEQIDPVLEEAGRTCGASFWQVFGRIVIPLLRSVLVSTFALALLANLRDLLTPLFLASGSGRTMTLPVLIYTFWGEANIGESAAFSMILVIITLLLFAPLYRRWRTEMK